MFRSLSIAHRLRLELFLRCFDDLIEHFGLYFSKLFSVLLMNNFVEFSERFSQARVIMVLDAVVSPEL